MSARIAATLAVAFLVLASGGCHVARPSELPRDEAWIVSVKSCRLPEWEAAISRFAHHTWFDLKLGDEASWKRVEVLSSGTGVRRNALSQERARSDVRFGGREVRVLETLTGERAQRVAARVLEIGERLSSEYQQGYVAWPGPNSNTFVAEVAAEVDELAFPLHHNAVGKDYPGWFAAGLTTSKTGVRVDTLPVGFALGVREGVEVHVLQLSLGVSLFPPRLKLPFLPEIPWSADVAAAEVEAMNSQATGIGTVRPDTVQLDTVDADTAAAVDSTARAARGSSRDER